MGRLDWINICGNAVFVSVRILLEPNNNLEAKRAKIPMQVASLAVEILVKILWCQWWCCVLIVDL